MADRRTRDLWRRWRETGDPTDGVAWGIAAYRQGHRSMMACLSCHGCEDCACLNGVPNSPRSLVPTPPRSKCRTCGSRATAGLEDSVVIGSVLGFSVCEVLAGWTPRQVPDDPRQTVGTALIDVADAAFRHLTTGGPTRPLNLYERSQTLTRMGAQEALRRVVVALAGESLRLRYTTSRERVYRLLELWALERCRTMALHRYRAYYNDSHRVRTSWLPWGSSTASLHVLVSNQVEVLGPEKSQAVLAREVEPWLLGVLDPLRERVTARTKPESPEWLGPISRKG